MRREPLAEKTYSEILENYFKGSICRIFMKDFLTYDSVEVFPGPNLNLIVGPNGTGKSTIVCAICLGFGGVPKILGRSTQLTDYIKHGKETAVVEIEIVDPEQSSNPVIQLEIRSIGNCKFSINKKQSTKEQVRQLVRSYGIQVDNLCQFLAQDRVVEFSRQTPQELLENTEKAAGDSNLYEWHQRLKEDCGNGARLKEERARLEEEKTRLGAKLKDLEPEVANARCFEERKTKLKNLELKRPWIEFEKERKVHKTMKEAYEAEKKKHENEKESLQPLRLAIAETSKKLDSVDRQFKSGKMKADSTHFNFESKSNRFDELGVEINRTKSKFNETRDRATNDQRQIDALQNAVDGLRRELEDLREDVEIDLKLQKNDEESRQVESKLSTLEDDRTNFTSQIDELRAEKQGLENILQSHANRQNEKLAKLRDLNQNAYNAYRWFEENRRQFCGRMYLPFMAVNVQNPNYRKFIEAIVARRDWFTFLFDEFEDLQKFMSVVERQRGWKVSCAATKRHPFNAVRIDDQLKNFGFFDYVANFFDAPEGVKTYLVDLYKMNQIPVGNIQVENNLNRIIPHIERRFRVVLTENKRLNIRFSKYTRKSSVLDTNLGPPTILMTSTNEVDVKGVTERKQAMEQIISQLIESFNDCRRQSEQLQTRRNALTQEKQELTASKSKRPTLVGMIRSKEQSIARLMKNLPDLKELEEETREILKAKIDDRIHVIRNAGDAAEKFVNLLRQNCPLALESCSLFAKHNELREKEKILKRSFEDAEHALKEKEEELEEKRCEVAELMRTACHVAGLPPPDVERPVLPDELRKIFQKLPTDLEEIEKEIDDVKAKLETMRGVDKNALREYNEKSEQLQIVEQRNARVLVDLENWTENFETDRKRWVEAVDILVETISRNFSRFLQMLKCAGEVDLDNSDEENFSSYGIRIKVKFRDNEPLHELTHQRQSGGERSVSTILYMLSLQELSHMPFRCVDEINQGMDPINERKVFDMMVKLLSGENMDDERQNSRPKNLGCTQYFMLTPKLLSGLTFNRHMRAWIIHNGEEMISGRQWNLSRILDVAKNVYSDD